MKNTTPLFYRRDTPPQVTLFENSDATNFKIIATGGADDSHVFEILIASTDTVARQIEIWKVPNNNTADANVISTGFPLKISISIPVGQGTTTLFPDPIRLINTNNNFILDRLFDRDQNFYTELPSGWYLMAKMTAGAVSATKWVKTCVKQKDF